MYATSFKKRGRVHLEKQLKINHLLDDDETNEEIMHHSLQEIIPLFDIKSILLLITANAKEEKLGPIFDIIAKQKRKEQEPDELDFSDSCDEDQEEEEQETNKVSPFSLLSNESISHISDYLDFNDVTDFKLTSRQIGIICLQQMNKTKIGIFNMNSLTNKENENECIVLKNSIIWTRYHPNTKYAFLYQEWERKYNISESNQLIFSNINVNYHMNKKWITSAKPINSDMLSSQTIKKDSYFIIDKKNVIYLDNNSQKKLTQCNDIQNYDRYKLLILEYFDVLNQRLSTKQFILYNGNITYERISKYIQNEFIPIESICNEWYQELKTNLNLMRGVGGDQQKLMFYPHGPQGGVARIPKNSYSDRIRYNFMRLTFQLNVNHKWFKNTNKLKQYKNIFYQKMELFYPDTRTYYDHNKRVNIDVSLIAENKNALKQYIESHYMNESNHESLNVMLKLIDQKIRFKVKSSSYSYESKRKIAELFENIIDPKDIQLFTENENNYNWDVLVRWTHSAPPYIIPWIKYKVNV